MTELSGESPTHRGIPKELDDASSVIIGAAIEVHKHLSPGLLESVYEKAMAHELRLRGLKVEQQLPISVVYKDLRIDGQRLDLLVQGGVIVELKAIDKLLPLHEAQLLSYLKSTGFRLGLLINFNLPVVHKGIKRIVN
jgi:GxxExxY protein